MKIVKHPIFYIKLIVAIFTLLFLIHGAQLKLTLFYTLFQNTFYTVTVLLFCYCTAILNGWRWHRLNTAQKIFLPLAPTMMLSYISMAFNYVLPGSVGGDFFRLYVTLKNFPDQKNNAALSIFADRLSGLMSILLIASICAFYYLFTFKINPMLFYLFITCIGICLFGFIICMVGCMLLTSEKIKFAHWIAHQLKATRFANAPISLREAILLYKNSKLILCESLLLSLIGQILLLIAIFIISSIMHFPSISPIDYIFAFAVAQIANLIPLTPGGIGIGEAAFANVILLLNPGVSAAYATIFLALRLLNTITYLPGVMLGIFKFRLKTGYTIS